MKYKIPIYAEGEVQRVFKLLENAGYLLNHEYRMKGLGDSEFNMIESQQDSGCSNYVTYNNDTDCICKRIFELGWETDEHVEISIEDFLKLNLINS